MAIVNRLIIDVRCPAGHKATMTIEAFTRRNRYASTVRFDMQDLTSAIHSEKNRLLIQINAMESGNG